LGFFLMKIVVVMIVVIVREMEKCCNRIGLLFESESVKFDGVWMMIYKPRNIIKPINVAIFLFFYTFIVFNFF